MSMKRQASPLIRRPDAPEIFCVRLSRGRCTGGSKGGGGGGNDGGETRVVSALFLLPACPPANRGQQRHDGGVVVVLVEHRLSLGVVVWCKGECAYVVSVVNVMREIMRRREMARRHSNRICAWAVLASSLFICASLTPRNPTHRHTHRHTSSRTPST